LETSLFDEKELVDRQIAGEKRGTIAHTAHRAQTLGSPARQIRGGTRHIIRH
jgi:hypothetical protein